MGARKTVTVHDAKTNLSRYIKEACAGTEIVIARGKTPVVRLAPIAAQKPKRTPGRLKGIIKVDESFFDPLPPEELDAWEGKSK
ncbi:MAG: type II toxin-antitoxin system prevent-host-death family antitoxin [Alphaproteobacteria bacterium]|nr:type II toxin-antitoxin system prevent-host-death family antitoxin [Alphaproteobacteria bacterium]